MSGAGQIVGEAVRFWRRRGGGRPVGCPDCAMPYSLGVPVTPMGKFSSRSDPTGPMGFSNLGASGKIPIRSYVFVYIQRGGEGVVTDGRCVWLNRKPTQKPPNQLDRPGRAKRARRQIQLSRAPLLFNTS